MKALILAAGFGTRLASIAPNTPKTLLPLGEGTVLDAQIKKMFLPTIDTVFILTNDKFHYALTQWHRNTSYQKEIKIINNSIREENKKRGSIGDLDFFIKTVKPNDDLIVLASDNLFTHPFDDFINFFYLKKAPTIALHKFSETNLSSQGNEVMTTPPSGTGRVTAFVSKPVHPRFPFLASMFYIFPRHTLHLSNEYLRAGKDPDSGGSFIAWLVAKNYPVFGYLMAGKRFDVGDIQAYQSTLDNISFLS